MSNLKMSHNIANTHYKNIIKPLIDTLSALKAKYIALHNKHIRRMRSKKHTFRLNIDSHGDQIASY